MKNITAIPTWVKGQIITATILNIRPIGGELYKFSSFYYQLLSDDKTMVAEGNLTLDGDDYQSWEQDDFPFEWAAGKLNLEITGDYVEPVVEPVIESVVEPVADSIITNN